MNKVLRKMDYKGQTAVLSAIFVLVGTICLLSGGTEKALATVSATGKGTCGPNTSIESCMFKFKSKEGADCGTCKWVTQPTDSGTVVTWTTTGGGAGNEKGSVTYTVTWQSGKDKPSIEAKLGFSNPVIGSNSCSITTTPNTPGSSCNAGKGQNANFEYNVRGPS